MTEKKTAVTTVRRPRPSRLQPGRATPPRAPEAARSGGPGGKFGGRFWGSRRAEKVSKHERVVHGEVFITGVTSCVVG